MSAFFNKLFLWYCFYDVPIGFRKRRIVVHGGTRGGTRNVTLEQKSYEIVIWIYSADQVVLTARALWFCLVHWMACWSVHSTGTGNIFFDMKLVYFSSFSKVDISENWVAQHPTHPHSLSPARGRGVLRSHIGWPSCLIGETSPSGYHFRQTPSDVWI